MKTKFNKLKLGVFLCCSTVLLFIGCEKGNDGEDGAPGKNGSSNVESRTFSVSSWSYSSPFHYTNLSVPELTQQNINSAGVMVYFSTTGTDWVAVPYTQYNSPYNYFMGFNTSVGIVQITWVYDTSLSQGSDPTTYYGVNLLYKVVVVPPSAKILYPNIDYKNYSAVKETFHLKD